MCRHLSRYLVQPCKTYYSEWDAPGVRVKGTVRRVAYPPWSGCRFHHLLEDHTIRTNLLFVTRRHGSLFQLLTTFRACHWYAVVESSRRRYLPAKSSTVETVFRPAVYSRQPLLQELSHLRCVRKLWSWGNRSALVVRFKHCCDPLASPWRRHPDSHLAIWHAATAGLIWNI
jgi:hypothetical protein